MSEAVSNSGPEHGDSFLYVDISSIDNCTKRIEHPKWLPVDKAPSRARQRLQPGDVLVSMTRPNLNAVALVPSTLAEAVGSTGFCVLRPYIEAKYLFYRVQSLVFIDEMTSLVQGALYPAVRPKDVLAHRLPLAPLDEQRRIVQTIEQQFTRLDACTSSLKAIQAKLKRYRAAVLKAAVEGTLTAAWRAQHPDVQPASVLLQRILEERRSAWEQAELAKYAKAGKTPPKGWRDKYKDPPVANAADVFGIPDGWCWTTLSTIAALKGGITKGQQRRRGEQLRLVPYLRVANVQRGFLDLSEIKYIEATQDEIDELRLLPSDILFNEGGDRDKLGRGWIWSGQIPDCIHQNHVFRARLYVEDVQAKYVSWYGNSFGQSYFIEQGKQTTNLASINLTKLSQLPIPLPPPDEQEQIVTEVERRLSVVAEIEAQIQAGLKRAERLRQSILTEAFAGRLVPQNPGDEPADVLLERLHHALALRETARQSTRKERDVSANRPAQQRSLWDALSAANSPLQPGTLFDAAGYTAESVDAFYQALREEVVLKKRIKETRPNDTDVYLEALNE